MANEKKAGMKGKAKEELDFRAGCARRAREWKAEQKTIGKTDFADRMLDKAILTYESMVNFAFEIGAIDRADYEARKHSIVYDLIVGSTHLGVHAKIAQCDKDCKHEEGE